MTKTQSRAILREIARMYQNCLERVALASSRESFSQRETATPIFFAAWYVRSWRSYAYFKPFEIVGIFFGSKVTRTGELTTANESDEHGCPTHSTMPGFRSRLALARRSLASGRNSYERLFTGGWGGPVESSAPEREQGIFFPKSCQQSESSLYPVAMTPKKHFTPKTTQLEIARARHPHREKIAFFNVLKRV
jgi:hypothetical protein